jgi:hypothetical protein
MVEDVQRTLVRLQHQLEAFAVPVIDDRHEQHVCSTQPEQRDRYAVLGSLVVHGSRPFSAPACLLFGIPATCDAPCGIRWHPD